MKQQIGTRGCAAFSCFLCAHLVGDGHCDCVVIGARDDAGAGRVVPSRVVARVRVKGVVPGVGAAGHQGGGGDNEVFLKLFMGALFVCWSSC